MRRHLIFLLIGSILVPGCGESTTRNDSPPGDVAPATTPAPAAQPAAGAPATSIINATVQVVDLHGAPLPRMTAVVTRQPNAFDEPVATGSATNAEGVGTIRFTSDELLYLRAWDPGLNYFPNNFYEVLPGGNAIGDNLVIQMVPAASIEAQFFLPSGEPASNQTVKMMLFHATRGPWWPAEAQTNAEGVAVFTHLPAGEFLPRFKAASGRELEHGETALPPGAHLNLGALSFP